jgi:hypothetical protein
MEGESCVLALLHGNTTFRLTSVKLFHVGDIKVSSKGPEDDPKYYVKGEGDGEGDSSVGIIPPAILAIILKRSRGRPYKNLNMTVFLLDDNLYEDSR